MASQLTPGQVVELERSGSAPLVVEHPLTHRGYVLIPTEAYQQARPLFDAIIHNTRESLRSAPDPAPKIEWTDLKNERRCLLIDKKHDAALTPDEQQELDRLQTELAEHQRASAPRPLAILELLEEALRMRAATAGSQ